MSDVAYTPGFFGVQPSAHCSVCGRALTNPVSIMRGIGPECYGQGYSSASTKDKPMKDVILKYDEQLDGAGGPWSTWEHRYAGHHSPELNAVCKVRVYASLGGDQPNGPDVVVLITELPQNEGLSVTNGIEKIATKVALHLQTIAAGWNSLTWVEHYPDRHPPGSEHDSMFDEDFSLVTFERGNGLTESFGGVTWKHITRDEFLTWIGRADVEVPA